MLCLARQLNIFIHSYLEILIKRFHILHELKTTTKSQLKMLM